MKKPLEPGPIILWNAVLSLIVLGLIAERVWPLRGAAPSLPSLRVFSGARSEIAAHRWWSKPLPIDTVDAMVDAIVAANSDEVLIINRSGRFMLETPLSRSIMPYPQEFGRPLIHVRLYGSKRYTESQAANAIQRELDSGEFDHGPGR